MFSAETSTVSLGPVTFGPHRISIVALLPADVSGWGAVQMNELRELGACAAMVWGIDSLKTLSPAAQSAGIPLVVGLDHWSQLAQAETASAFWVEETRGGSVQTLSLLKLKGKPLFWCGQGFPPEASVVMDPYGLISQYPAWSENSCPWGMTLGGRYQIGQKIQHALPLSLAGVAAGAQVIAYAVHTPHDLESIANELKAIAPVLGRELTRIPKQAEMKTKRAQGAQTSDSVRYAAFDENFRVAFQGEHGAYSEMAVFNLFPHSRTEAVPLRTFRDVFAAVLNAEVDFGMLPIENALAGPINENFDLLLEFPDLHIVAETQVRVEHNLIGIPGTPLSTIQKVLSHPQGLAQSRQFLESHPEWESVPFYDTAGSVAHVARTGDPTLAAIASAEAARVYAMEILVPGVETNHRNFTRFLLLAPKAVESVGSVNKATLVFATADEPGALSRCLAVFATHGVNMKKLESRPIHGKPWDYMFYVDVQIPAEFEPFEKAVEELRAVSKECRLLGLYQA